MISRQKSHHERVELIQALAHKHFLDDYDHLSPLPLVDVHCHLTHETFDADRGELLNSLGDYGLKAVVINGLEPISNRQTLELAASYSYVHAAVGIYPLEAIHHLIPGDHELKPPHSFNLETEIGWIEDQAHQGRVVAIGECGLDGYYFAGEMIDQQQQVLCQLARIAKHYNLPLIVHSRKCERRIMHMLAEVKQPKVLFHCYMGKVKWAVQGARDYGWCFSIPAIVPRHQGFQRMLAELSLEHILTETDSPYLSQIRGIRNDPRQVIYPLWGLAQARQISTAAAAQVVWANFQRLFAL